MSQLEATADGTTARPFSHRTVSTTRVHPDAPKAALKQQDTQNGLRIQRRGRVRACMPRRGALAGRDTASGNSAGVSSLCISAARVWGLWPGRRPCHMRNFLVCCRCCCSHPLAGHRDLHEEGSCSVRHRRNRNLWIWRQLGFCFSALAREGNKAQGIPLATTNSPSGVVAVGPQLLSQLHPSSYLSGP
jgi:hypothetical protein